MITRADPAPREPSRPVFLIAGSLDPSRGDYDPPLATPDKASDAAAALGAELARHGCRIIVYSGDKRFVECEIVRGYLRAVRKRDKALIQVRLPYGASDCSFGESADQRRLFDYQTDTDLDWEATFYRSLQQADGLVLVGGGRSTLIVGHVAIGYRMPILALATFGGAAQKIWRSLNPARDLVTEADWHAMSRPEWRPESAAELITGLLAQHGRRLRQQQANARQEWVRRVAPQFRAAVAGLLFVAAALMAAAGSSATTRGGLFYSAFLYLIGPLAGAAGSLVRAIWAPSETDASILATAAQGFCAGLTAALLYIVAQLSTAAEATQIRPIAFVFALVIGTVAGFTFDKVFRRMARADIAVSLRSPR